MLEQVCRRPRCQDSKRVFFLDRSREFILPCRLEVIALFSGRHGGSNRVAVRRISLVGCLDTRASEDHFLEFLLLAPCNVVRI